MVECWVYVIHDGYDDDTTRHLKIGMANSPIDRVRSLQTGNPNKLFIDRMYCFPKRSQAEGLEFLLHDACDEYSVGGEWFYKNDDIDKFLDDCEILLGANHAEYPPSDIYSGHVTQRRLAAREIFDAQK